MTIAAATALGQIAYGLAVDNDRITWDKASIASMVAGNYASLWRATGIPGQGAIPGAAALCTKALTGAVGFTNQGGALKSYIAWHTYQNANAGSNLEIHDRLAHMGGLVGNITTSQATTGMDLATLACPAARLGAADYSDVKWWLEWYTATGATASNATVNVTYDDASTGNLAVIAVGGTAMAASRKLPLVSAVAGRFIKGVNSVILSASTGTAGNFGVTASRQRTAMSVPVANKLEVFDWPQLGLSEVPNDACLYGAMNCITTSTGVLKGDGKIIHA